MESGAERSPSLHRAEEAEYSHTGLSRLPVGGTNKSQMKPEQKEGPVLAGGVPLAQRRPRCTPGWLLFFSFVPASCFGFLEKEKDFSCKIVGIKKLRNRSSLMYWASCNQ